MEVHMNKSERTVDMAELAKSVLKRLWMVFLAAALCGGAAWGLTVAFAKPEYEASALLYVNNSADSQGSVSSSSLTAAQELVDTYIVILKSRSTVEEIIRCADVDLSCSEVSDMLSAESVDGTEIFGVTVTGNAPETAEKIASAVCEVLPRRISDIVEGSSVRIVDCAAGSCERSGPDYGRSTMLGIFAGIAVSLAVIIILEVNDPFVREKKYLAQTYDIPVFSVDGGAEIFGALGIYINSNESYKTVGITDISVSGHSCAAAEQLGSALKQRGRQVCIVRDIADIAAQRGEADMVLLSLPPVHDASDAAVYSSLADAVIVTVDGQSRKDTVNEAAAQFRASQTDIAAFIYYQ